MTSSMMSLKELVLALFKVGAIKFGKFKLKIHEEYPDAPLSPFYVSLRTKDNKDGKLTDELVLQIAYNIELKIREVYPVTPPAYLCGLPRAGEPFVRIICERLSLEELRLVKQEFDDGSRKIVPPHDKTSWPVTVGYSVLGIIDDLVTKAGSKLEGVEATREMGFMVKHVFVFLDRGNGTTADTLARYGIELVAVLTDRKMFDILVEAGRLTQEQADTCINYRHQLDAYIFDQRKSLESESSSDSSSD